MADERITLSKSTIHNPAEPRHFMRLKPVCRRIEIRLGDRLLAASDDTIRLVEVGRDVYDPVIYVPSADVRPGLVETSLSTHCPLKGDTVYYDLTDAAGRLIAAEIAWRYAKPLPFAAALEDLIAFDHARVSVTERPF